MLGNDWNSLVKGCTGGEDKGIRPNQGYQPVQRAIHEGNIRPQALKNGSHDSQVALAVGTSQHDCTGFGHFCHHDRTENGLDGGSLADFHDGCTQPAAVFGRWQSGARADVVAWLGKPVTWSRFSPSKPMLVRAVARFADTHCARTARAVVVLPVFLAVPAKPIMRI